MNKKQRKEAAFLNLLGVDTPPTTEYPDSIRLPHAVATVANLGVLFSDRDFRERSARFSYHDGEWYGTPLRTGGTLRATRDGLKAHTGFRNAIADAFTSSHISMHTHPDFLSENGRDTIRTLGFSVADFIERPMIETPSIPDVQAFVKRIGGKVAHLLASSHGRFLSVYRPEWPDPHWLAGRTSVEESNDTTIHYALAPVRLLTAHATDETARDAMHGVIAHVTQQVGVHYFSPDPESLTLERIPVPDISTD